MNIPVQQLPSGGYGYGFSDIKVSPMSFLQITQYLEGLPEDDKLEKYLYEINNLISEDKKILDCYLMDVDFLIFFKKLITISGDSTVVVKIPCPKCGKIVDKKISLDRDIHFRQIDQSVMEGSFIELGGNKYETIVPTVKSFFKVFEKYLKYRKIEDLDIIKTIALIKDFDIKGNQIEDDILGATHGDITLIKALQELYTNRLEPVEVICPNCGTNEETGERSGFMVDVTSLTMDFFRDIRINCPIDGTKIVFKQTRQG